MEQLKKILDTLTTIEAWKIVEETRTAEELFFIKKKLDMNRSKEVHVYKVTLYVEFEEEGKIYLGEATTEIDPSMEETEIRARLSDTRLAASFIKNQFYKLPEPSEEKAEVSENRFATGKLYEWMPKLAKAIYKADVYEAGGINSLEIFLNKSEKRILSSKGMDVAFVTYKVVVDLVAEWNDGEEPVELATMLTLGDIDLATLEAEVVALIEETRERAHAQATPNLESISVILTGEAVKDFLAYYMLKSNAKAKYEGISDYTIGQKLQGEKIEGTKLEIDMVPILKGSSQSAPFDQDGTLLKPVKLVEEGSLKTLIGSQRFASYLNIPATGVLTNMKVGLGTVSVKEMKETPYIELLSFSSFQMRPISGDTGGEIRLAYYYDGETTTAVTGGALSTNIKDVQSTMIFSSESVQYNNYYGPKYILFKNMAIAGR